MTGGQAGICVAVVTQTGGNFALPASARHGLVRALPQAVPVVDLTGYRGGKVELPAEVFEVLKRGWRVATAIGGDGEIEPGACKTWAHTHDSLKCLLSEFGLFAGKRLNGKRV